MRKKLLCTLLTAALLLTLFPTAALADEWNEDGLLEGVAETVAEEQAVVDPELLEMLPSNDELFSAYVDLAFAGEDADVPSFFGVGDPAYNRLGEKEKKIYTFLKDKIQYVAGNGGSTVFDITECFKTEWTSADIDGQSVSTLNNNTYSPSEAVVQAIKEEFEFDSSAVVSALLFDCPYDLYWYDKTNTGGASNSARYSSTFKPVDGNPNFDPATVILYKANTTETTGIATMTFCVADSYQGTSNTQVKNAVLKVGEAATNAGSIVRDCKATTDYDRLLYYKNEICDRVSYNRTAADNSSTPYGDPWQLIDVFAGGEDAQVVCEGYAKAFQYLCDLTKKSDKFADKTIESYIVTGTMDGGTGAGNHMWNVVSISDKNYLVDVTNCDTGTIGAPDKLFLVGKTAGDDKQFSVKIDDNNTISYVYDTDLPWGSEILRLAGENYRPYTPEASTVKIFKNDAEITQDTLAIGSTAIYTAKVYDQKGAEMSAGIQWGVNGNIEVTNDNNPCTIRATSGAAANDSATLTATFSGNTEGETGLSASVTIKLLAKESHKLSVTPDKVELSIGSTQKLTPNSSTGGTKFTYQSAAENVATVDSNGVVTAVKIGTTKIIVTVADTEQYASNSIDVPVTVTGKTLTAAMVTLEGTSFSYTGKAIEPKVSIAGLTQDTDFTVAYSKNVDAGTATVTVTGLGSYSGTVTKEFTIKKAELVLSDGTPFSIMANASENASEASLLSIVKTNNPSQTVFGQMVEMEWVRTSPAFNRKGATYTFTGTGKLTAEQAKNYVCSNTVTVTVEVKPVTVKSVTVTATTTTIKANQIDSYELPTAGTVEYNEITGGTINITWPTNYKETLKAAADKMGDASKTTVTLTAESVYFEDWATVPASFAKPTLTVTITNKEQATVSINNASAVHGSYGGSFTAPVVSGTAGETKITAEKCKFTYTGISYNGVACEPDKVPEEAGDYTVTVTYEDDTYFGSASTNFTIDAKDIELVWAGAGEATGDAPLTYNGAPMKVTASIMENSLKEGDTCTVTVTGGDKVNAGEYVAKATLGNKNYKAINDEITYTINRGDRGVYISDGKIDITGKTLNLYPATGLKKAITVSYTGTDDAKPTYHVSGDATAISLQTGGNPIIVTAVGNGHAKLTVSFDETENYVGTSVSCELEAIANPISQISIGSKNETVNLAAKLDGSTIKVVGLGDPADICVKLVPAEDVGIALEQSPDSDTVIANGDKISLKDGDNLVAEYTVDLSGVTKVPAGTSYEETKSPATSAKPELNDTAVTLAPESEGLTAATANELIDAAKKAIEAAGEGATVKVEASLQVQLQGMTNTTTEKVLSLEIKPVYVVKTTKDGNTTESETIPMTSALAASVTIKVTLPAGFPTDNLYAKHYNADGVTVKEFIRVVIDGGKATWEQDSFSKTDLVQDTRSVTVVFNNGTKTETHTFTPENVGDTLPNSGTSTGGWSIEGKTYTTLTDELLTLLVEKSVGGSYTVNKTDAPDTPVTPPVDPGTTNPPSSSGGGGGGGSSSSVSRKVSINKTSNGTISSSHMNPTKGTKVTLTAKPKTGYVLDTLRVLDAKGNELELTKTSDGKYTFIMPDGKVTVDAKFVEEGSQTQAKDFPFTDAADSWARDAIAWAYENGYVNGTSDTTFNPNGSITRQQMWMILARLSGASPANMAEAREWAMSSGVTDGTNGGNAMTRQQMVTFLYRYVQNRGYTTGGGTSLDSFPDNAAVSEYAREPLAWAVGNGIVAGTSDGTLNPGGGATRAQFAVILQRFYSNTVES